MRRENLIKTVTDGLSLLAHRLEGRAAARLYDLNVVSEGFFKDFLNCLRGLALENLNGSGVNHPAIDLGDKVGRVAFQVTTERTARKIRTSLHTFLQHQLDRDYDQLFFLILGKKQARYAHFSGGTFEFDPARHVLDIPGLIREATGAATSILSQLAGLVVSEGLQTLQSPVMRLESGTRGSQAMESLDEVARAVLSCLFQEGQGMPVEEIADALGQQNSAVEYYCEILRDDQFVERVRFRGDQRRIYGSDWGYNLTQKGRRWIMENEHHASGF